MREDYQASLKANLSSNLTPEHHLQDVITHLLKLYPTYIWFPVFETQESIQVWSCFTTACPQVPLLYSLQGPVSLSPLSPRHLDNSCRSQAQELSGQPAQPAVSPDSQLLSTA